MVSDEVGTGIRWSSACEGSCRDAKVKCPNPDSVDQCERCSRLQTTCVRLPSKRGRLKGSKNRKTLDRLRTTSTEERANLHNAPSSAAPLVNPSTDMRSPVDRLWSQASPPSASGSNLRSRERLQIDADLEDTFPTSSENRVEPTTDTNAAWQQDLQHPLLLLAEYGRRGWDAADPAGLGVPVLPAAISALPAEDERLRARWGQAELQRVFADQQTFFQHGLFGSKRDVGEGLDAVQRDVISEADVEGLFEAFFRYCNPIWPILDSALHTPSWVRKHSAYLFTVILALGATSLATLTGAKQAEVSLAEGLHRHAEKLQLVLCATAAKSVEIVQAEQLLQNSGPLRKSRLVDDQRWVRLGMANRLSVAIGLQDTRKSHFDRDSPMEQNRIRLRTSLILGDNRWESVSDRKTVSPELSDLTSDEMEFLASIKPTDQSAMLAADYALYQFEADSQSRLSGIGPRDPSSALNCEKVWLKEFLRTWDEHWRKPHADSLTRWRYEYAALRSHMIGLLRIMRAEASHKLSTSATCADMLDIVASILRGALCHERALHMPRTTSPIVFAIRLVVRLTPRSSSMRDLALRVALRMAGDPYVGLMTYSRHSGFQLIHMLCLSKEANTPSRPLGLPQPQTTAQTAPLPVPTEIQQSVLVSDDNRYAAPDDTGLDHLFLNSNHTFPYVPGTLAEVFNSTAMHGENLFEEPLEAFFWS